MNKNDIPCKLKKGEQSFLRMTHYIYLRHISKKIMKISQVVIELWGVQEWKRHKISIKQQNGHTSEMIKM